MPRSPDVRKPHDPTEQNPETLAQYKRAFEMLLRDKPPGHVDAVFLHALYHGDDDETVHLAASYVNEGNANYIVINGSDGRGFYDPTPGKAWAGSRDYIERLVKLGVNKEKQIIVSRQALHTRESTDAYLEIAKAEEYAWRSAVMVNQPQQLVKAMLAQVKSMEDKNYWMRVYAAYPEPWDATKKVRGPQGDQLTNRYNLIGEEYDRVITFQREGDLATFEELFEYMEKRSEIR